MARFSNLARAMGRPCDLLQAGVIEDPFGVTVKIHVPGFTVEEFRCGCTQGEATRPR